jgi:hypothetical protein
MCYGEHVGKYIENLGSIFEKLLGTVWELKGNVVGTRETEKNPSPTPTPFST